MIRIDAIDLHTHLSHGMPGEPENTPLYRADLPYLLGQYQRLHIACGVFSTFASVLHGPEGVYEEAEPGPQHGVHDPRDRRRERKIRFAGSGARLVHEFFGREMTFPERQVIPEHKLPQVMK